MLKQKLILKGIAASAGMAEGLVRIVKREKFDVNFGAGNILVTEMTEPAMAVIMNKAAAIITDLGGLTCHAAIISRELGIPCVVATKRATKILKSGMNVKVDGTGGAVYIIKSVK